MFRLLRDAQPERVNRESLALCERTFEDLFRYPPLRDETADAWHMVIVTLIDIRDRLAEVTRTQTRRR